MIDLPSSSDIMTDPDNTRDVKTTAWLRSWVIAIIIPWLRVAGSGGSRAPGRPGQAPAPGPGVSVPLQPGPGPHRMCGLTSGTWETWSPVGVRRGAHHEILTTITSQLWQPVRVSCEPLLKLCLASCVQNLDKVKTIYLELIAWKVSRPPVSPHLDV